MSATLQPLVTIGGTVHVWIARSGPKHERYGDAYEAACVIVRTGHDSATIEAMGGLPAQTSILTLRHALKREGIVHVFWQRVRNVYVRLDADTGSAA